MANAVATVLEPMASQSPLPGLRRDGDGGTLLEARQALERVTRRYRQLFDLSPIGFLILACDGVIRDVNRALCELMGQRRALLCGQALEVLVIHEDRPRLTCTLSRLLEEGTARCEVALLGPGGRPLPCELTFSASDDEFGRRVQVAVTDLSEHKRTEAELRAARDNMRHLAYHDALTGLPNRLLLNDRLAQALLRAARRMSQVAVLFLDVDRFKSINDELGHAAGDQVLREFARRVRGCMRKDDTVARVAGDEFVVVLENVTDSLQVEEVAQKIRTTCEQPLFVANTEVAIGASIGIAMYPLNGKQAHELLEYADQAMFLAKRHGRGDTAASVLGERQR